MTVETTQQFEQCCLKRCAHLPPCRHYHLWHRQLFTAPSSSPVWPPWSYQSGASIPQAQGPQVGNLTIYAPGLKTRHGTPNWALCPGIAGPQAPLRKGGKKKKKERKSFPMGHPRAPQKATFMQVKKIKLCHPSLWDACHELTERGDWRGAAAGLLPIQGTRQHQVIFPKSLLSFESWHWCLPSFTSSHFFLSLQSLFITQLLALFSDLVVAVLI